MKKKRLIPIFVTILTAALLTAGWLFQAGHVQASSASDEHMQPDDDSWLRLIISEDARNRSRAGINASLELLTLNLDLYARRAAGHVSLPTPVHLTVTRQGETLRWETVMPVPDALGYFYISNLPCGHYSPCGGPLEAGDQLWVRQGSSQISLTVPALTVFPNATREVLTGTAPGSASLTAYRFPFDDENAVYTVTAIADAAGNYSLPLPGLRPRDGGYLLYELDASRRVYQPYRAPFLLLQANGHTVAGQVLPWQDVSILYPSLSGEIREFYAWSDQDGHFSRTDDGYWWKHSTLPPFAVGTPVTAQVYGGVIVSTTVQTVTAQADQANDLVFGQAAPGAQVTILHHEGPLKPETDVWDGQPTMSRTVTADALGQYTASLPLGTGNYGIAQVENGDGHQSFDWFAAPYAEFRLGWSDQADWYAVRGQTDKAITPLTVTVQGPSGYLKSQYAVDTLENGYFPMTGEWYWGPPDESIGLALEGGDRVTVTQAGVPIISATMPTLTLDADYGTEILHGEAPPNALLTLEWKDGYDGDSHSLSITASVIGIYQVPFSALGGLSHDTSVNINWTSPQGYRVQRGLSSGSTCAIRFPDVSVGGNEVWLHKRGWDCSGKITVLLFDSLSALKAEEIISWRTDFARFEQSDGTPIPIEAGDSLKISYAGDSQQFVIPPFSVQLDPDANRILGQAPAGQAVNILFQGGLYHSAIVTASSQSAFTYTLPSGGNIEAGDKAIAWYQGAATFSTLDVLPFWEVNLYPDRVSGVLPPLTPYTVTLLATDGLTGTGSGYASNQGEWDTIALTSQRFATGDQLTLTTSSETYALTVPLLTVWLNPHSGTVNGQVPPGGELTVSLSWYPYREQRQQVKIAPDGSYIADFPDAAGQEQLNGSLMYRDPAGYAILLNFSPPHWEVTLGSYRVSGTASRPGDQVAFSWQSITGTTYTRTLTASAVDGRFYVNLPEGVRVGDQLVMTDSQQTLALEIPLVTAEYDYANKVLTGIALPNALVDVQFDRPQGYGAYGGGYALIRRVYADSQGFYGMDTSDLHPPIGSSGYVETQDAVGNRIRLYFKITGYRIWMPIIAR